MFDTTFLNKIKKYNELCCEASFTTPHVAPSEVASIKKWGSTVQTTSPLKDCFLLKTVLMSKNYCNNL